MCVRLARSAVIGKLANLSSEYVNAVASCNGRRRCPPCFSITLTHISKQCGRVLFVACSAGLGKLANLSSDYVDAVAAVNSLEALQQPSAAVPFNADSSMGSAAPAYVSAWCHVSLLSLWRQTCFPYFNNNKQQHRKCGTNTGK
jgi:hypothetical protein